MINYSKGNKWTTLPDVRFIWRNPVKKSISRIVHVAFTIVSVIERLDCARFWRQISRWICKDNFSSSSRQLMYSNNSAIILNDPLTLKKHEKILSKTSEFPRNWKNASFSFSSFNTSCTTQCNIFKQENRFPPVRWTKKAVNYLAYCDTTCVEIVWKFSILKG